MHNKALSILAAAALTVGAAGFASSANAATPATSLNNATALTATMATAPAKVENVGVRFYFGYKPYYYPTYNPYYSRCKRWYRLGFVYGYYWAKKKYWHYCQGY